MVCKCKQCGREFTLTDGEIAFYENKGLNLPKRCKECRQKNNPRNNDVPVKKPTAAGPAKNRQPSRNSFDFKSSDKKPVYNFSSKSSGKGLIPLIISVCLIPVVIIAVFAVKHFNNDVEPVMSYQSDAYVEITDPDTSESTEETSAIPETETEIETTTVQYAPYYDFNSYDYNNYAQNTYRFRNNKLLTSHYQKHGIEMGFSSKEAYESAAAAVITDPRAVSKPESDDNDGDMVYFIKSTGEIVFISSDGFIRTYFIASEDYYNRQ